MRLFAKNNYLIVEIVEQREENNPLSAFISTQGVKKHNIVKIIDACKDSRFFSDIGKTVLFQSHLLEQFEIEGKEYYVIPESSVYGVFGD